MLQSTIIERINNLHFMLEINLDLGRTGRAEMNQAAIDRLTLLIN